MGSHDSVTRCLPIHSHDSHDSVTRCLPIHSHELTGDLLVHSLPPQVFIPVLLISDLLPILAPSENQGKCSLVILVPFLGNKVSIYNASCVCVYVCVSVTPMSGHFCSNLTIFGSNSPILVQICLFWLKFAHFRLKFAHFCLNLTILAQIFHFGIKFSPFGSKKNKF